MQNQNDNTHKTNKNKNNVRVQNDRDKTLELDVATSQIQKPSMSSLIIWNVNKVLEKNPDIDLKSAIKAAQDRLERDACCLNVAVAQCPEEQHFVYAFLAWQQLGHASSDSLYKFIESQTKKNPKTSEIYNLNCKNTPKSLFSPPSSIKIHYDTDLLPTEDTETNANFRAYSKGPVIKLPVETKIVMRCETHKNNTSTAATSTKIEAACCMESVCSERLSAMDAATAELRARAAKLANREAQRATLLERAEAAWGDVERGYQKRLTLAEEKEDDISRQIKKLIEDRNADKNACTALAQQLKEAGDAAMKEQATLKEIEKTLCGSACTRLKLNEEAARGESALTDLQCKVVQLDRDLQFKEEQARRRLLTIDSETESARMLTHEAERALRAELGGLREQIEEVSVQLLEEDEVNKRIKAELEQLREDKQGMIEDLDGCKALCDSKMQARLNEMKKKREELEKLKEKVIDCQCKMPVDVTVTAKRTPSLAALCGCAPEDRFLESCSCTSLRGSLLSTLLADLFSGLQSELCGDGLQMPCQLLKCLEDKHNWDRSSVVKSNLRNFFSKLLVGELDIAIATSIEKYHAKWVGASCADEAKMSPDPKDDLNEGWEQRALERRAQKLATMLAEQLFEERAEELSKQAKQIVASGPPPCECNKTQNRRSENASILSCLTEMKTPFGTETFNTNQSFNPLQLTQQEVTDLKLQVQDLKKETIKKEDFKLMEEMIAQLVKQCPVSENDSSVNRCIENTQIDFNKKQPKYIRHIQIQESPKCSTSCKTGCGRRKLYDINCAKKCCQNEKPTKQTKRYNHNQSFAVNLCMCEPMKANKESAPFKIDKKPSLRHKTSKEIIHRASSIKQAAPINIKLSPTNSKDCKELLNHNRDKKHKCLHETPSTTSIDRLFATLTNRDENCKSLFKNKDNSIIAFPKPKRENEVNECELGNETNISSKNNPKFNIHRAVNTASIYMATVNLDKNSEFASKSINTINFKDMEEQHVFNNIAFAEHTNQYKQPCNLNISSNKHLKKVKDLNKHLNGKIKNTENFNILINSKTKTKPEEMKKKMESKLDDMHFMRNRKHLTVSETIQTELIHDEKKSTDVIKSEKNKTDMSAPDLDYYIKFLGVTLTDTRSQEQEVTETNNCNCKKIPIRLKQHNHKPNDNIQNREPKYECELNNFGNKQINNNLKNSKWMANTQEQCVCCNKDSSKDLEENAFHLLEDHLKQKLRELKTCSCEASSLLPEEEEKIFSNILQKVRQVISNYANRFKCTEPEGSWKRAYGLLKEYLKIKIKRVQGLPLTNKRTHEVLPDILDKVCNLIDNDFQRLKDTCKCNKHDKSPKIMTNTLLQSDSHDLPERDTNICRIKYSNEISPICGEELIRPLTNIQNMSCQVYPYLWTTTKSCEAMSETKSIAPLLVSQQMNQNTIKPLVLRQTTSAQVPPHLAMETKSCDVMEMTHDTVTASKSCTNMEIIPKEDYLTSNNYVTAKKGPQEQVNNLFDSYHYPNILHSDVLQICRNKELLLNLYADVLVNCDLTGSSKQIIKQNFNVGFSNSLPNLKKLQFPKTITTTKNQIPNNSETPANKPYFGYTIHCSCDDYLSTCVCVKSIIKSNTHNINNEWPQFIARKNNSNDYSYIMNSSKKVSRNSKLFTKAQYFEEANNIIDVFLLQPRTQSEEKIVSMVPVFDTHHHAKNMQKEVTLIDTDEHIEGTLSSFEKRQSMQNDYEHTDKKTSRKSNEDLKKSSKNIATIFTETTSQKCDCDKVPICHVRMLIENIERSLMASKCTCDSISIICPLHSRQNK